nr:bifunctional lysine-specific demethylase and histidyl-hydroxylase NO66-like [Coffea arabica]
MRDEEDTKVRKSIALKVSQDEDETISQDGNDLEGDDSDIALITRETDLKDADTQDSPAGEVNDRDTTTPNDLPRTWKFVQNHPRELIIGDPSEKMEEQNSEGNIVGGNEEPERATQGDETNKGNIAENQQTPEPSTRKSPRTMTEAQNVVASATQISKGKRSGKDQKEPRPDPTGPTTGTEATPPSNSQPKDKGKAPATEEAYEEDDEETEEKVDPEQFRLARRRPGSSKITI